MPVPFSVEVFPPRSVEASFRLKDCVAAIAPFSPSFLSVTYGAGGSSRAVTQEAVAAIRGTGLPVAGHLTCAGQSRDEVLGVADAYAAAGVTDIVALRGDAAPGEAFRAHPQGFAGSAELVGALAARFRVHVACYPERHPDAADEKADIEQLKRKVDAGAQAAITQFFFRPESYFRFREAAERAGIHVPIVPGILPAESWPAVRRMAARCGAVIPATTAAAFERAEREGRTRLLALATATSLCERLVAGGAESLHLYSLNRAETTRDLCLALGLGAAAGLERVA